MIWDFLSGGGFSIAPIVACSVLGLALLLERAFFWLDLFVRRDARLREELSTLAVDRRRAERTRDPLCRAIYRLIRHPDEPALARGAARRLVREARAGVRAIGLFAQCARALGLVGAAVGASLALDALQWSRPEAVAGPLAAATRALAAGIAVSIPAEIGAAVFGMLADRLAFQADRTLDLVRARLKTRSVGQVTYTG